MSLYSFLSQLHTTKKALCRLGIVGFEFIIFYVDCYWYCVKARLLSPTCTKPNVVLVSSPSFVF